MKGPKEQGCRFKGCIIIWYQNPSRRLTWSSSLHLQKDCTKHTGRPWFLCGMYGKASYQLECSGFHNKLGGHRYHMSHKIPSHSILRCQAVNKFKTKVSWLNCRSSKELQLHCMHFRTEQARSCNRWMQLSKTWRSTAISHIQ